MYEACNCRIYIINHFEHISGLRSLGFSLAFLRRNHGPPSVLACCGLIWKVYVQSSTDALFSYVILYSSFWVNQAPNSKILTHTQPAATCRQKSCYRKTRSLEDCHSLPTQAIKIIVAILTVLIVVVGAATPPVKTQTTFHFWQAHIDSHTVAN
jgi:hypothetical protein